MATPTIQPLPGLEPEAALLEGLKPYTPQVRKRIERQVIATALAERLLGHSAQLEWSENSLSLSEENPEESADVGESLRTRFATLLLLSASDENHVVGTFDGIDGQTFEGGAALWKSSLRIDPSWMEAMRRRTRKVAKERFEALRNHLRSRSAEWVAYQKRDRSWSFGDRFLTLTMPKIDGASSYHEIRRFNAAMRALFKGEWWERHTTPGPDGRFPAILGGIKAVEDALSAEGPHVHGHFMLIARRLDQDGLRDAWQKAVVIATRKIYKITLDPMSKVTIPDLRTVTRRVTDEGKHLISYSDALEEVCKYLTKPADLLFPHVKRDGRQVDPPSPDVLFEICMVKRWPRMFELFGAARKPAKPAERPSLDTSCISVPGRSVPYPELWGEQPMEPEERCDLQLRIHAEVSLKAKLRRARPPSWRDLMDSLGLHEWMQVVAQRFIGGVRFRERFLRAYNPSLDLIALDGRKIKTHVWPEECILSMC